jgi:hypothetical protein
MQKKYEFALITFFSLFAILFLVLAIIGGMRSYSPIPFWDMWNGYLDFYAKIYSGNWFAWWAQHNEHRIVLARIFFWLDIRYFHGQGWLLIVVNYLLLSVVTISFVLICNKVNKGKDKYLALFLVCWLFFWSQHQNLTWGFQSQFILAQLFPFIALWLLSKSVDSTRLTTIYFSVSVIIGFLSIGSMANGIITLPLMWLYALILRMTRLRTLVLFVLSIICICLYFYEYHAPPGHGSLTLAIRDNPIGLIRFMATYLGSPFYYVFGKSYFGKIMSEFFGILILSGTGFFIIMLSRSSRDNVLNIALLFFIIYIIGTSLGTAGGRLIFGIDQALEGRYTTPALMVWGAAFLIIMPYFRRLKLHTFVPYVLIFLLIFMLQEQVKALDNQRSKLTEQNVAALSLALDLEDEGQIKHILPSATWGQELAKIPRERQYSIFGYGNIQKLSLFMHKSSLTRTLNGAEHCTGYIDSVHKIDGRGNDYLSISGWAFDTKNKEKSDLIYLLDSLGNPAGVGFIGIERQDVANSISKDALYSGFKGYVKASQQEKDIFVEIVDTHCFIKLKVPLSK